ncbi:MAG TPA: hypothetical protein VF697_41980, partial [Archangium sp.]
MKVLFFPLTADGHVNPILPLARELLSRGEEVVFYATAEYETVVRNIGASFRRIDSRLHSPLNLATQQAGGGKEPNPKQLMPLILEQMLHGMREAPTMAEQVRTEQADCIVYDTMSSWGRTVAGLVRVPAVAFHATYAMRRNSPLQRQMSKNMGAPPLRAVLTLLRMVWTARQLQRHHGFPRMPMGELMNASE